MGNLQRAITAEVAAGQGRTKAPTLEIANGLFLQQGFAVEPTFASGLQQHLGAAPETVDFFGNPSGSLATVNGWVSDHTNGLIPQLFGSLPTDTRLVLANALYLKASWLHAFERWETWSAPFHAPAGSTRAQFMHETERLRYGSGQGYRAVDLPYRASTLSLSTRRDDRCGGDGSRDGPEVEKTSPTPYDHVQRQPPLPLLPAGRPHRRGSLRGPADRTGVRLPSLTPTSNAGGD